MIATPFELTLENELNVECQRFDSDWLFQWYGMTYEDGKTDVPDFKGGRIRYAGIRFGSQQQQIFWHAIGRYLNQKIHEVFRHWNAETKDYPLETRLASIDGVERTLASFSVNITSRGLKTAQRLRNGDAQGHGGNLMPAPGAEIQRLAEAHRQMLKAVVKRDAEHMVAVKPERLVKRMEKFIGEYKGIISLIGVAIAAIGLAIKFL
jgi:hypothetical protein